VAYEAQLLDATNLRILEELQADARLTMAELGRRVSLSPPAVADRVQRLERAGVINGYHAAVDPKAIGYPIAAVVRVRPASRQLHKIPEVARELPEVVECYRITGEDCFFVKLHLRSMDDLEGILDRFVLYGQTTTSIVHSAPVSPRPLPLGG
jgi:Lrp/AsnC family leucine-responsive transcriptional regulator